MSLSVVPFPTREQSEGTAKEAREYADRVEGEEASAIIIHWGKSLRMEMWGSGLNAHEILGLIDVAKAYLLQELMSGGDE